MSQDNLNVSHPSDRNSPPHLPPESSYSSMSSMLQNEYSELLKYTWMDLRASQPADTTKTFQPIILNRSPNSSSRQTPVYDDSENLNSNSVYPNLFANKDESEEMGDSNVNKTKVKSTSKTTKQYVHTAVTEPCVQQMSCKLDGLLGKLKSDILAEMKGSLTTATIAISQLHEKEKQDLLCEKESLQKEVNRLSELVCTVEKGLNTKDTLIENLSAAFAKEKAKICQAKAFYACKDQVTDKKRKKFTEKIAKKFYETQLSKKVMKCWFGLIQQQWRDRAKRLCEAKAQGVCAELTEDYERKIKQLNEYITCLEGKVHSMQCEREQYSKQVKKAFMRGVCALNMEAMSAFATDDIGSADADNINQSNTDHGTNVNCNMPSFQQPTHRSLPEDMGKIIDSAASRQIQSLTIEQKSSSATKSKTSSATAWQPNQKFSLAPPMASVVVERHDPITKKTIGKATAAKYPKKNSKEHQARSAKATATSQPVSTFKPLAGQIPSNWPLSVKIVD